jgi:tetratricopeptide (TPR) repeat protein
VAETPAPRLRWPWLWPLLAALAVYAIAPRGALVWDDQLVAKQQMAAIDGLGDVFAPPPDIPQWSYSYYRPVVVVSYLLDQWLFGRGAAVGPHVANVLYHLLVVLGVYGLTRRVLRDDPAGAWGALAAGLLFAVHPLHVESVSWITGRSDVLAAMLLLPALLLFLRWRDQGSLRALLLAPLLLLAAMLAKEVALAGLLLVPLLLWLVPSSGGGDARPAVRLTRMLAVLLALGGAALLYFLLRVDGGSSGAALTDPSPRTLADQLLRASAWYTLKLAWPWPQSHFVTWEALPATGMAAGVVALAAVAVVFAGVRGWGSARGRQILLALGWIGVTLAPAFAVALTSVAATPVAERYLYLPSAGLALLAGVAAAWSVGRGHRRTLVWAGSALVVALGAATLVRGLVWQSDLRLWADVVERGGGTIADATPLIEYGKAQFQAGRVDDAEASFRRARAAAGKPRLAATAEYNLGIIAIRRGAMTGAERHFSAARDVDPGYALGHYGLGRLRFTAAASGTDPARSAALLAEAEALLREALRLSSSQATAWVGLANVVATDAGRWQAAGDAGRAAARYREALDQLDRAVALEPALASQPEVRDVAAQAQRALASLPR